MGTEAVIYNSFGEYLKTHRKVIDLNQTELGKLLGYNQNTISKWELGITTPYLEQAEDIIKYFGGKLVIVDNVEERK